MFKIEITGNTTAELASAIFALAAQFQVTSAAAEAGNAPADKPKRQAKKTETGEAASAQEEQKPAAASETATESASPSEPVDRDGLVASATKLTQAKGGIEAFQALLGEYGAEKLSGVTDDKVADFTKAVDAKLAELSALS